MVYEFDQAVWEQVLLMMKEVFEECYRTLTNTLRRCRDKVGDNLQRDFSRGMKITSWDKLWQILLFNYKAIVDLRYLEVSLNPRSRSGWDNTAIYRAQFVKYVYDEIPGVEPTRGVLLFYWPTDEAERKGFDNLKDEIPVVVDQLTAACIAGSRSSSFRSCCATNPRVQYEFQYLAGLTSIPHSNSLTCLIIVAEVATGHYRSERLVIISKTVKEFKYHPDKWKFSGGISANGSVSARFSWPGARGVAHNGIVCIARKKDLHVEDFVEMTRDASTGMCRETPFRVAILTDAECLNSVVEECSDSETICTML